MPLHVDFQRIGSDNRVRVGVPVRFINEALSPGLKRGGVLNVVRHDVEVWCPANAIPQFFEVDLTGLAIGRSIHISAVALPEGVKPTIADRDFTIATIAGSGSKDDEETPAAGAAAAPVAGDGKAPAAAAAALQQGPAAQGSGRERGAEGQEVRCAALRRPESQSRSGPSRSGRPVRELCRSPRWRPLVTLGGDLGKGLRPFPPGLRLPWDC